MKPLTKYLNRFGNSNNFENYGLKNKSAYLYLRLLDRKKLNTKTLMYRCEAIIDHYFDFHLCVIKRLMQKRCPAFACKTVSKRFPLSSENRKHKILLKYQN